MLFKKHHLILVIISLILVVAFIFPANIPIDSRWSINTHDIETKSPHIWIVDDIDNLPGDIVSNDFLYIKKIMDKYFSTKYATILPESLKVYKKTGINTEELILQNPSIHLIKSTSDDTVQEYYLISRDASFDPERLPVGDLVIRYIIERKFNGHTQELLHLKHEMTVLSPDDHKIKQLQQGDDSSL